VCVRVRACVCVCVCVRNNLKFLINANHWSEILGYGGRTTSIYFYCILFYSSVIYRLRNLLCFSIAKLRLRGLWFEDKTNIYS